MSTNQILADQAKEQDLQLALKKVIVRLPVRKQKLKLNRRILRGRNANSSLRLSGIVELLVLPRQWRSDCTRHITPNSCFGFMDSHKPFHVYLHVQICSLGLYEEERVIHTLTCSFLQCLVPRCEDVLWHDEWGLASFCIPLFLFATCAVWLQEQ